MSYPAQIFRSGTVCVALLSLLCWTGELRAQTPAESAAARSAVPNEPGQAELLKSYLHVREQLHAAELANVNNRLETEATARAQAAAITEKIDALKSVMATELEHQQVEAQRAAAERQQVALQDANRLVVWMAAAFGSIGLLTMFGSTLLLWRGIKHLSQITAQQQQMSAPLQPMPVPAQPMPAAPSPAWLAVGNGPAPSPSGEAVAVSNQRLMSVIDRMERRIMELEHSAIAPLPDPTAEITTAAGTKPTPAALDQAARIAALLGKGRSLLNANKAQEALVCFDEILAIEPNLPEALVKKGSALERLKKDLEAIECYDRAIKADRNMALAYLSKGGVFNRLQRFDEAVECYEKALQVEKEGQQSKVLRVSVSGEWPASGNSVPA